MQATGQFLQILVLALEMGGDLVHEFGHLVLDHAVRFGAHVEIEDYLGDAGGLHLFQSVDDFLGAADENRLGGQV